MEALERQHGVNVWLEDAEGSERYLNNLILEAGHARRMDPIK